MLYSVRGDNKHCIFINIFKNFQRVKDCKPTNEHFNKVLWFIGTARNALVVVTCAVAAYIFEVYSTVPFILTGHIRAGLPTVQFPQTSAVYENRTINFFEMCETLGTGIIVVPLVAVIGNVAIAKAFCTYL